MLLSLLFFPLYYFDMNHQNQSKPNADNVRFYLFIESGGCCKISEIDKLFRKFEELDKRLWWKTDDGGRGFQSIQGSGFRVDSPEEVEDLKYLCQISLGKGEGPAPSRNH